MKPSSLSFYNSFIKWNQLFALALMMASLPLSNQFMSIAGFWMACAWLLDIHYSHITGNKTRNRFREFLHNRNAVLLSGIYLLTVLGILWSENMKYALWDLRIKLPLLFMPLVLVTFRPIEKKHFNWLILVFNLALLFGVFHCLGIYYHLWGKPYTNVREISHFISHIRFSLLLVMGICSLYWLVAKQRSQLLWALPAAFLYLFFLWIIESMTGFSVLLGVLFVMLLRQILAQKNLLLRYGALLTMTAVGGAVAFYILLAAHNYFTPKVIYSDLSDHTVGGEKYFHSDTNNLLENGYYVWTHIAWGELTRAWKQRSEVHPDSLDGRKQPIKGTLIRYLTSKGLFKDSIGVWSLTDNDVKMIESGKTSYLSGTKKGLANRLDKIFFEIDNYRNGGDPSGNSVTQRIEFWKCAIAIISENPIFGVGTGDVNDKFQQEYESSQSQLDKAFRLRSHNQYLTYSVALGVFGGLYLLLTLLYPLTRQRYRSDALYVAFATITILSFMTEDSLETQAGVTFFTFFSCLLLFIKPRAEVDSQ